jgi:hypothetical protein
MAFQPPAAALNQPNGLPKQAAGHQLHTTPRVLTPPVFRPGRRQDPPPPFHQTRGPASDGAATASSHPALPTPVLSRWRK